MNFKRISIILSLFFCNLNVLAVPLDNNDLSDTPENVVGSSNILEDEIYDTLPVDDIDEIVNVTDAVIDDEEMDSDSDDEIATISTIDTNECTSDECIEISKRILSNLDTSVNPCDDFYEFSCGGWMAMNNNNKEGYYSVFDEIGDKVKEELHNIFEIDYKPNEELSPKDKENDEKLYNIMKNLYTQCINSYNKDYDNKNFITNFINNFNISEKLSKHDGLTLLLTELNFNGFTPFIVMDMKSIDGLPYKYIPLIKSSPISNYLERSAFLEIELSKEELSLEENFRNEDEYNKYLQQQKEIIEKYQDYIKRMLQIVYGSDNNEIDTMVESVIKVERRLSRLLIEIYHRTPSPIYSTKTTDYEDEMETENINYINDYDESLDNNDVFEYTEGLIDENYENYDDYDNYENSDEIINIKTLNEKYPLINWKLYFEKLFGYYGIEISISDELMVSVENDFIYLHKFFEEINNNDLMNYIEWNIIDEIVGLGSVLNESFNIRLIPEELGEIQKQYKLSTEGGNNENKEIEMEMDKKLKYKKLSELEEDTLFQGNDTNSKCFKIVSNAMPLALSKYYVEINFTQNTKSEAINMVENIRNAMIKRIQELEWLDESTRKYAIEKVLKIKYNLGYLDIIKNNEMIYNYYKPLENVHDDFLSIVMGIMNIYLKNFYSLIYNENPEYNMNEIKITPTYVVNAYYMDNTNIMYFPAAVLQTPNFDVNQLDYINYGNMGTIMGHELTHAFDNNGKNYDSDGNEFNWWTDNDNEEFNEFSQCFIDQYGSYSSELEGKKYFVNGTNTLGENLADNGGLDRAFEAWKMSI